MSGRNPVLPITLSGKVLEVPTSPLSECRDCVCEYGDPPLGSYVPSFLGSTGSAVESTLTSAHSEVPRLP